MTNNTTLFNEIISPLDQFEIRNLLSLEILGGNIHLSLTNIGLYLTIGSLMVFIMSIAATNYNKLVSNN
jgi:F0F1-type ATP synthase membrane subunit a